MTTVGSLCTGYGGLDLAVEEVLGARTVWTSDIDEGANRIIAERFPDAPNIGDLKTVDWSALEPVDIITAGYPCQPFSQAGKRKGLTDDRHIWPHIRAGVRELRPRLVVLENVSGHRSMGLDRVLGDLAEDGFDAWWTSVRASDVGAAHRRERLFIVAAPAGTGGEALGLRPGLREGDEAGVGRRRSDDDRIPGREGSTALTMLPTPRASDGTKGGPNQRGSSGDLMLPSAVLLPTPGATDGTKAPKFHKGGNPSLPHAAKLLPTPLTGDYKHGTADNREAQLRSAVTLLPTPTSADGASSGQGTGVTLTDTLQRGRRRHHGDGPGELEHGFVDESTFGQYATAVARWETIVGRPAPPPTEATGRNGAERLAPTFVEWLMGLPAGHVTDVDGLTRNAQLKALGNGVVPQQAAAGLRLLLTQGALA